MGILKKALGIFVELDDKRRPELDSPEADDQEEAAPPPVVLPDAPADLSQDPDVLRVREAVKLLADLPLADIPVDKARSLISKTLEFAGMEPEELMQSFRRAAALYQAMVQIEEQQIAARKQLNQQRLDTLQQAMAEEQRQCQAEVALRGQRIEGATAELTELEKAMAFFETEPSETQKEQA